MAAAPALIIIGSMMSAASQLNAAQEQSNALDKQAQTEEENAKQAHIVTGMNVKRQQMTAEQAFGAQHAAIGASGVSSDSESALESLRQSHTNSEYDRQNILNFGSIQESNARSRAAQLRSASDAAMAGGAFSAFTSLFSGATSASMKYKPTTTNNVDLYKYKGQTSMLEAKNYDGGTYA